MPTLEDLVARQELRLAVGGAADGLGRDVRWVHVTELPDPSPYVKEAELVLTNGLWLAADVAVPNYVERIAASGACGLMFGLLEERPEPPLGLDTACRDTGLPLLVLPIDVPFTAVSEAMASLQGAARQRELAQTLTRGNALAQAIAEGAAEADVLRLLTRDHALPVALVDHAGRVLAADGLSLAAAESAVVAAAMDGPAHAELTLAQGTASVFPVGSLGEVEATLVCLRPLVELSDPERTALQQTARFLTLELTRRQALAAIESRFAGELMEMLYDAARRGHEVPGRLRSFAIDPDGPLVALSVTLGQAEEEAQVAGGLAAAISRHWLRLGVPAVVLQGSDDAVAILGWAQSGDDLRDAAESLAAELSAAWPEQRPVVGLGSVAPDHSTLRRSLLEAREARRAARRRRGDAPAVATFDHVGSHQVLLAPHDRQLLDDFATAVLEPVLEHDREHRTDLVATLRAFLDGGGRWSSTAEALHVHVNTLRNRLARIEQLTGRDLDTTEDRVDLFLALEIRASRADQGL
ncbi:MAG TPA: helix-turn-helix domain-containing protein [Solirubrobacterales bacterium]|nr:helix-turn-helix domain-containing protein [Solirubrobacterales bacterium]